MSSVFSSLADSSQHRTPNPHYFVRSLQNSRKQSPPHLRHCCSSLCWPPLFRQGWHLSFSGHGPALRTLEIFHSLWHHINNQIQHNFSRSSKFCSATRWARANILTAQTLSSHTLFFPLKMPLTSVWPCRLFISLLRIHIYTTSLA